MLVVSPGTQEVADGGELLLGTEATRECSKVSTDSKWDHTEKDKTTQKVK